MKNLIQIIEDDKSVKKLLEIAFKEFEFEFISSENKKNALLMFLSHNPNLLVVDLGLPDGDGKDLIKQIIMPIGLDIKAETPSEIAISIVAQLIQKRAQ